MGRQARTVRVVAVAIVGASVLGAGSLAWACTIQARVLAVSPLAGPQATTVSVRGEGGLAAYQPVELRWNAKDGPKIASAVADADGDFSAAATVPQAAPGVYAILAFAGDRQVARAAFEVFDAAPSGGPLVVATEPTPPPDRSAVLASSDSQVGQAGRSGSRSGLAAGTGMLALGLMTVFVGFGVAGVRRRRQAAAAVVETR